MTGYMSPNLFVPSAQTYVRSALATVGIQNNTFGYFPHAVQVRKDRQTHGPQIEVEGQHF